MSPLILLYSRNLALQKMFRNLFTQPHFSISDTMITDLSNYIYLPRAIFMKNRLNPQTIIEMRKNKFAFATLVLLALTSCTGEKQNEPEKPNIIYILADDLGYNDLSCYGQEKFETPNIDAMAENGIRFTDHYSGSTVCAPSRSVLLTGLHTGHSPIRGNKEIQPEGQHPMPENTRTIAHELKEAGYTNACIGKWGLGYPGSESTPLKMGFDYFFGYNCQRHAHHYFVDYLWENDQKIEYEKSVYSHDRQTEKALNFVRENKEKPFFLFLAYTIPHAEMVIPDKYLEPFIGKYPEPSPFPGDHYGAQEHPRAALAAMITHLDSDVGRLKSLLKELEIDENTLVIFTSDNGPHIEGGNDPDFFNSNGPFRGYKRDLYEGGIRVPFVAKWPGIIEKGRVSNHVSAMWDIYPTFCEIAGIDVPKGLDGISMLPELKGEQQPQHDYLYWEFHEKGDRQAVRKGKWKGVRYDLAKGNREVELYNLESDPGETKNIADQHPEIAKTIREIMISSRKPSPIFEFPLD